MHKSILFQPHANSISLWHLLKQPRTNLRTHMFPIQTQIMFVTQEERTNHSCVTVAVTPVTQTAQWLQKHDLSLVILASWKDNTSLQAFMESIVIYNISDMNNSTLHSDNRKIISVIWVKLCKSLSDVKVYISKNKKDKMRLWCFWLIGTVTLIIGKMHSPKKHILQAIFIFFL